MDSKVQNRMLHVLGVSREGKYERIVDVSRGLDFACQLFPGEETEQKTFFFKFTSYVSHSLTASGIWYLFQHQLLNMAEIISLGYCLGKAQPPKFDDDYEHRDASSVRGSPEHNCVLSIETHAVRT